MTLTNYGTPVVAIDDDIPDLVALHRRIEEWLAAQGIDRWRPSELDEDRVHGQVALGQWYVLRSVGTLVAAFRVLWSDPEIWGETVDDGVYARVLMVDRGWGGRAVGAALLDWVGALGAFGERDWLRLACAAGNERLGRYAADLGFAEAGSMADARHRDDAVRWQRHT